MCATEVVEREPPAALAALAARWDVPCDAAQTKSLIRYADLLLVWGARINLTGAQSVDTLIASHFPDAFALAKRLDEPARLIDVGSGGGLPGLPLALLCPRLDVQLCEPVAKKGAFLRTAIRELGLSGRVRLDPRRGEDLAAEGKTFDAAVSRATFKPTAWLGLGRRLVRAGGRVFALATPENRPEKITGLEWVYAGGTRILLEVPVP
jgi:16S rRNA (guanine527-N7)-methyltransferase